MCLATLKLTKNHRCTLHSVQKTDRATHLIKLYNIHQWIFISGGQLLTNSLLSIPSLKSIGSFTSSPPPSALSSRVSVQSNHQGKDFLSLSVQQLWDSRLLLYILSLCEVRVPRVESNPYDWLKPEPCSLLSLWPIFSPTTGLFYSASICSSCWYHCIENPASNHQPNSVAALCRKQMLVSIGGKAWPLPVEKIGVQFVVE